MRRKAPKGKSQPVQLSEHDCHEAQAVATQSIGQGSVVHGSHSCVAGQLSPPFTGETSTSLTRIFWSPLAPSLLHETAQADQLLQVETTQPTEHPLIPQEADMDVGGHGAPPNCAATVTARTLAFVVAPSHTVEHSDQLAHGAVTQSRGHRCRATHQPRMMVQSTAESLCTADAQPAMQGVTCALQEVSSFVFSREFSREV